VESQKRLYRSTEDRMFAGVCGGIGEYLDVDSTLVRLVFVALALMGGPGLLIYIVLMLIVPERPAAQRKAKREARDVYPAEAEDFPVRAAMPVDQDEPPVLE
jgi:phage shock protein C